MTPYGNLQGFLIARLAFFHIQHIRDKEYGAAALDCVCQIAQGSADIRPVVLRFVFNDFADYMQQLRTAFARRNELLDLVAEQQTADLVVVEHGGKSQSGGNLRSLRALGPALGPEKARAADVHGKYHGQFPLLLEYLDIRGAHASGHIPVHASHVVAIAVLTHLAECHSPSLEGRMVFSGENLVRQGLGLYLDFADFFEKLFRGHITGL